MPHSDLPTREQEQELHQRLLAGDNLAPVDLAKAYYEPLVTWLRATNSKKLPEDLLHDAATHAWESLCKKPSSYPGTHSLWSYLKMSAQADLKNLLKSEAKHCAVIPLDSVQDDSALRIVMEDDDPVPARVFAAIGAASNDEELRVLALLRAGEKRTEVYARELGIGDLPIEEQRRRVNLLKGRVKKRLDRYRDDS